MQSNKHSDIWMVHATTSQLLNVAPGMVMLDVQATSKYPMTLVGNLTGREERANERLLNVVPSRLSKLLTALVVRLPYRIQKNLFFTNHRATILFYLSVVFMLRKAQPKIVVVHVGYALCWLIKWMNPKTEVVYYHHGGNMHLKLSEKHWNRLVKACPHLILSVSKAAIEGCRQKFKTAPQHFEVVHNGVAPQTIQILKSYNKQELFNTPHPFVFCFAGRINRSKGIDILLTVFETLSKNYPHARLLLIGDLDLDPKDQEKVKQYADKIHLTGKIPKAEVASYQILADVGLLLSQETEGNSLFAIESFHLGIPLIVTNKGGNKELLDTTNPPGLMIEVDDQQATNLYQTMEQLITDSTLYNKLKINATLRSSDFTLERMGQTFDQAIDSIQK